MIRILRALIIDDDTSVEVEVTRAVARMEDTGIQVLFYDSFQSFEAALVSGHLHLSSTDCIVTDYKLGLGATGEDVLVLAIGICEKCGIHPRYILWSDSLSSKEIAYEFCDKGTQVGYLNKPIDPLAFEVMVQELFCSLLPTPVPVC